MITKTTKIDDFTAEIERTTTKVRAAQYTYDALVEQRLMIVSQQQRDNDLRTAELAEIDSFLQALLSVGVKSRNDNPDPGTKEESDNATR